jgi:uncharacterized protein with FMN-binding domain
VLALFLKTSSTGILICLLANRQTKRIISKKILILAFYNQKQYQKSNHFWLEAKKMVKMNKKMIALCSAAVGSIYLTGFSLTEPTLAHQSTAAHAQQNKGLTASVNQNSNGPDKNNGDGPWHEHRKHHDGDFSNRPDAQSTQQNQAKTDSAQQSSTVSQKSTYKDGTYTGESSNRIGAVQVAVTIKGGKISSVQITNCTTSYSESNIEGLPQQVVARQSANVDLVSGATLSSEDFQGAVQQALQQAQQ